MDLVASFLLTLLQYSSHKTLKILQPEVLGLIVPYYLCIQVLWKFNWKLISFFTLGYCGYWTGPDGISVVVKVYPIIVFTRLPAFVTIYWRF